MIERMTPKDTPDGQSKPFPEAVNQKCLASICRAGRREPAATGLEGTDEALVKPNQPGKTSASQIMEVKSHVWINP